MSDIKRVPAISTVTIPESRLFRVTVVGVGTIEVCMDDLHESIVELCAMHGLKQKIIDAAAMSRDPETGRSATTTDKFRAMQAVADRLLAGQWNAAGREATGGIALVALFRIFAGKRTEEEVRTWFMGKTDAERNRIKKDPNVAKVIAEIQAERAAMAEDGESLLDELN